MKNQLSIKLRTVITGIMTLLMGIIIAWEYFYEGGVTAHYFLHSKDMPSFSNWWGLLLIPVFTFLVTGFIKPYNDEGRTRYKQIFTGFSLVVLFGLVMSYSFIIESDFTLYLTIALLVSVFLLPIYRLECLLGYVVGMLFTFGAIIPILFGTLFWLFFQLIHKGMSLVKKRSIRHKYN